LTIAALLGCAAAAPAAVMSGGVPDSTYANLQLWLDAGFGVSHSGGAVTAWDDRSDKNHDATTSSGSPAYAGSDAGFANKPVIGFSADALTIPSTAGWGISGTSDRTIFVAFRQNSAANANVLGYGVASTAQMVDLIIHSGELAGHYHGGGLDTIGGGPYFTAPELVVGTHQYATSLQATTIVRTTGGTVPETVNKSISTQDGTFVIGMGQYTPYNSFDGQISEVLVYSELLSASDQQAVQEYLWEKYTVVPEPGSLALLAVGGLVMVRRRK